MTATPPTVGTIVRQELVPGARHWSVELRRAYGLRLTDVEGGANCAALFYNAHHHLERYNMADTLKAQHTAYLTRGHCLYSDMGRILVSITADSCGWHDALCGVGNASLVAAQYGESHYQQARNACHRNGRDSLLVELGKWGMGLPDLVANVNFFSKAAVDTAGALHFVVAHSAPGSQVELRAEMDTWWYSIPVRIHSIPPAVGNPSRCRSTSFISAQPARTIRVDCPAPKTAAVLPIPRVITASMIMQAIESGVADMTIVLSTRDPRDAVFSCEVLAGEPWLYRLATGQTLRILDLEGPGHHPCAGQSLPQRGHSTGIQ
jgi:urea carboxylase-associated protein 2